MSAPKPRMISADTIVADLLAQYPALVDVLADYHPHFQQLRDPQRRRLMAPRVTVGQAAAVAGAAPETLVRILRVAAGEPADAPDAASPAAGPGRPPMPAVLAGLPESRRVHLDVREDLRRGQEPFGRIMAAVKALPEGSALVLRAPFEPVPLYDVLGKRGLAHWTDCRASGDWVVWFYWRDPGGPPGARASSADGAEILTKPSRVTRLDVRGLEPPDPMVRVLAALEQLRPDEQLEVLHERRPMFLYPQLDERGFTHRTEDLKPGLVRILITRREGG